MALDVSTAERRILLLTPTGKDASLVSRLLARAGCAVRNCADAMDLCQEIASGVAAVVLAEEGLSTSGLARLTQTLHQQPAWSDLPVIVLTMAGKTTRRSAMLAEQLKDRANLAFLERPLRMLTLVSAVQAAFRARMRQYEVRRLLAQSADEVQKRDQFIAMLGHELRNPLAAIRASVEILNQFGCDEPDLVAGQAQVIDRQSKHMSRLVDDLLDVARLTSGRVALTTAVMDLRDTVRRSVEDIKLAKGDGTHQFEMHLPPHEVLVNGDRDRLEQILGNLLSNSVRYSPRGGKIDITLESVDGMNFIRIKDEGEGIEPELLPKIFEPFVQSTQSLARLRGGLGLGLAVVRSLVELHGGAVSVVSEGRGTGSEFIVSLPQLKERPAAAPALPAAAEKKSSSLQRILIVEDNADARSSLGLLFRLLKHEVFEAADGPSGLEQLIALRPDVALIDIGLPGLNGYEVAARSRAAIGDAVYLVALTGYGQAEDREDALAAGFDAHLVKPVELEQVSRLIEARSVRKPR